MRTTKITCKTRLLLAIRHLIDMGYYPSIARINHYLHRRGNYLNGRECKYRSEIFEQ